MPRAPAGLDPFNVYYQSAIFQPPIANPQSVVSPSVDATKPSKSSWISTTQNDNEGHEKN